MDLKTLLWTEHRQSIPYTKLLKKVGRIYSFILEVVTPHTQHPTQNK